jgi:putative SOS response-associated peptidase YedK
VRSSAPILRLLGNQYPIEVRAKLCGAELCAGLEQASNGADARCHSIVHGERVPKMMKWGLIPHWAKDDKL